jgi:hypothetical protein
MTLMHAPVALHICPPPHPPVAPKGRGPHPPLAHEAQGPAQLTAQQTSSPPEQKPVAQSLPLFAGLHGWPSTPSQTPAALHAWFAGQPP